ncbi:MAG: hypothetical protein J6R47_00825 [Acholeplasmatales bacterium]|nr:hypothetical protein [Acholeplasmatales bacterium]
MSENIIKSFLSIHTFNDSVDRLIEEYNSTDDEAQKATISKNAVVEIKSEYKRLKPLCKKYIKENLAKLKEEFNAEVNNLKADEVKRIENVHAEYQANEEAKANDKLYQKKYNDALSGEKIITKRAIIKAKREYLENVHKLKDEIVVLINERDKKLRAVGKKPSFIDNLDASFQSFVAAFNIKEILSDKKMWFNLVPAVFLIIAIVLYYLFCHINEVNPNLNSIITNGIYVAVVATGAVYIYSMGAFDMSLGPACLTCSAVAALAFIATRNPWISIAASIGVGMILGIVNAVLANMLDLPVMVMTLTMMNILNSIFGVIVGASGSAIIPEGMLEYGTPLIKWLVLIIFVLFCFIIFNYTKQGRRNKMVGSNEVSSKFSGVSIMKSGIISFALSGIGLGLAGFLYAATVGRVEEGSNVLSTIGLNVIIAIVFGGMPTSGGPRSRISAAVIGAFFCVFLDYVFFAAGIEDYKYIAKGILFLAVVAITSINQRTKMLTR